MSALIKSLVNATKLCASTLIPLQELYNWQDLYLNLTCYWWKSAGYHKVCLMVGHYQQNT